MKFTRTIHFMLCMALMLCWGNSGFAQISIPNGAFTDAQDFNTLANTGTSSTVPTGWAFFETGAN